MEKAGEIWLDHIHPDDREDYSHSISSIFSGRERRHDIQYRAMTKEGTYVLCTCNGVVIPDNDGTPHFFCGTIKNHDCLNYTDSVTNLRSLYSFLEDIKSNLWNRQAISVIMIGLEDFSRTNDIYNYTFGNRILRKFGAVLQQAFLGMGNTYRMDGTKFAIISEKCSLDELKNTYHEVQNLVAQNFYVASKRIALSLCAGAIAIDDFSITADTAYSCLKFAFAKSKNAHHGDIFLFEDSPNNNQKDSLERINFIRNCIIDHCKGFYLCYQPVVDTNTEKLKGAEALIRWKHDTYGVVPPMDFIPVLEHDSLFPELGKWILRQALKDSKKILETIPDFIINVNLSYAQLEKENFVQNILDIINEEQFPTENLCLEITERCRLLDINRLKKTFTALKEKGIHIALDDFGTGFSSLGVLRDLPINTVKIDREYVMNIEMDDKDKNTVRFISDLAKSFSAEVCAEGIETEGMRDKLRELEVTSLQGYYYSKPIEIEDFYEKFCK